MCFLGSVVLCLLFLSTLRVSALLVQWGLVRERTSSCCSFVVIVFLLLLIVSVLSLVSFVSLFLVPFYLFKRLIFLSIEFFNFGRFFGLISILFHSINHSYF